MIEENVIRPDPEIGLRYTPVARMVLSPGIRSRMTWRKARRMWRKGRAFMKCLKALGFNSFYVPSIDDQLKMWNPKASVRWAPADTPEGVKP